MAGNDITLNVGANLSPAQRQLQGFVTQAQRQLGSQSFQFKLDEKGFRQPLGRITGDLNQFQGAMDASIARTLAFGASVGAIGGVTKAFKDMVAITANVEHSLKEINILLNLSTKDLQGFSKELFGVAKNTASSFATVTTAATEFSRQGLSAAETAKRVNNALILTRLSGLGAEASVSALTAAVNGFKTEAITTTEVVNRLANVDAKFAVSSADLAKALSRAGAVSTDAKVKFNELVAATTAVQQATARGGNVIGNGFKTIFTRLQRSKVREELEKIGVATTTATGSIRGAIDVLTDYAHVYQTLTDQQKAFTSEQVAGVFQINTLKALVGDLSNEFGVYNQALQVANSTTNEAIQRNAQLNDTLQSLASQTGTEIEQLAAKIGTISFEGNFKGLLGLLKGVLGSMNEGLDSEGAGTQIATGIMKGIGSFLSGPGLTLALVGLTRLLGFIGKQTTSAIGQVLAIGSKAQKRQVVQQKINALLVEDNSLLKKIMASSGSIEDINKLVTRSIHEQNRALANQKLLVGEIARGFQITKAGSIGPVGGGASGGFVPNLVRSERSSISKGVGGARAGDRPVVIPNFNFGRGGKGTMVAHTGEHIVPNFAGGGSAIFNRNMVSSMGLPAGARRVAARGFIPNFAKEDAEKVYGIDNVYDGDTIKADIRLRRILSGRLQEVDAAETNQKFGRAATDAAKRYYEGPAGVTRLEGAIKGKGIGAYSRVGFADSDLASEIVQRGYGVPDLRYIPGGKAAARTAYSAEITSAQRSRAGIWGEGMENHPKRLMYEEQRGITEGKGRLKDLRAFEGSRLAFGLTQEEIEQDKVRSKSLRKKARRGAGGFIPNFANFKLRSGEKVSGAKLGSMKSSMSSADYEFAKANEVASAFAPAKAKTDPNMADAIYRTNQIVALVSNKMASKKGMEFATGTKDAVSFTAAGTKSLSGGPVQVENIIAPYVYKAAEVVFQQMTNQMPVGGIKNIPDGLKKMAGSVFEAATQKMVGTTQFKGNQNLDMPVVTGANKELLDSAFNTKGLTAMNAAEIKLGYNKALMQDVATKIIRSKRVSRGAGGPIDPLQFHAAGGFIPSFANLQAMSNTPAGKRALTTERALAGSSRMGFDSRVGYGVFNNSQGSLTNAVSQHLNAGDSMSSLASAGESAQAAVAGGQSAAAAVAAAAMGFLPNFAKRMIPKGGPRRTSRLNQNDPDLGRGSVLGRQQAPRQQQPKEEIKIDPKSVDAAENKLGEGVKKGAKQGGVGLAQVMAATFIAEQVSAFASQAFAKGGTFEGGRTAQTISRTTTATTSGFALGAQIHPVVGAILGVGAGLAAFSTSLDKASVAIDRLEFEAEKTAQTNSEGNAALTHYINLLGQMNKETDPTKARKLEEQLGDALSQIADQSLRQQVSMRATDMGSLRELEAGRGSSQREGLLKQNLDMASAVEKKVKEGNFYTRELAQYMTGATDTDDSAFEKWAKKTGGGITRTLMGVMGQDVTAQQLVGTQGGVQEGYDTLLSKVPFIGKKIAEKTAEEQAKVLEIRERVGTQIAGTSDYEGSIGALANIGRRLELADEGYTQGLEGLTLGGLYEQMGIDESQIPKQFLDRIDTDLSKAGDDIEDVLHSIAKSLKGELEFRRGKGREIAERNAAKAAEDLKKRLDALQISPDEIFGKAVKAGERRIKRGQATSKFMGQVESLQKTFVTGTAPDLASGDTKREATLRIEKEAAARGMLVSLSASSLKFQAKISEEIGKKDQDEDVVEALQAVREGITNGQSVEEILTNQLVQGQTGVQELLKDQLAQQKAIKKAGERAQLALNLNNLLQKAQKEEKTRATTREKVGGGRIIAAKESGAVAGWLDTINRGAGSRGGGTEALFDEQEAFSKLGKLLKGFISPELSTQLEGSAKKLATLGNVLQATADFAPGIKLGRTPGSSQEAAARIIPLLEKRLSGETRVSPRQELGSRVLLDALKQVQKSLTRSPASRAFAKFSEQLKYKDALQVRPDLRAELGVASLEQQQTGFANKVTAITKIVEASRAVRGRGIEGEKIDNRERLIANAKQFLPDFGDEAGEKILRGKSDEQLENALTRYSQEVATVSANKIQELITAIKAKELAEAGSKKELTDGLKGLPGPLNGVGALKDPITGLSKKVDEFAKTLAAGIKLEIENLPDDPPKDPEDTSIGAKDAVKSLAEVAKTLAAVEKQKASDRKEEAFIEGLDPVMGYAYKRLKKRRDQGKTSNLYGPNQFNPEDRHIFNPLGVSRERIQIGTGYSDDDIKNAMKRAFADLLGSSIKNVGNNARGSLGSAMARETRDISNGVGGAIPGVDKPTLIPNFNGGAVVAHTGEYLVNNYSRGKSAIFNRSMVGSMGMPAGAQRITAAGGYIPNLAYPGPPGGGPRGTSGPNMAPKYREFQEKDRARFAREVEERDAKSARTAAGQAGRMTDLEAAQKNRMAKLAKEREEFEWRRSDRSGVAAGKEWLSTLSERERQGLGDLPGGADYDRRKASIAKTQAFIGGGLEKAREKAGHYAGEGPSDALLSIQAKTEMQLEENRKKKYLTEEQQAMDADWFIAQSRAKRAAAEGEFKAKRAAIRGTVDTTLQGQSRASRMMYHEARRPGSKLNWQIKNEQDRKFLPGIHDAGTPLITPGINPTTYMGVTSGGLDKDYWERRNSPLPRRGQGVPGNVGAAGAAGPGGAPTVAQRQAGKIAPSRGRPLNQAERIYRLRQSMKRGGVGTVMGGSKARFKAAGPKSFGSSRKFGSARSGYFSEGFIPNFSMGGGLGSYGSVANEFLNFAEGGGAPMGGAAKGAGVSEEDRMYRLQGSTMTGGESVGHAKSSRQKHNVNVNIEVYGNVSEGAIDGIQSNSSDMATVLEGLVNGGM